MDFVTIKFTTEDWEKCKKVLEKYEEQKQLNREKARIRNGSNGESKRGRKLDSKISFEVLESQLKSQSDLQAGSTSSTSNQNV